MLAAEPSIPIFEVLKVDMYPFWHFSQKNLNWYPRSVDRSS